MQFLVFVCVLWTMLFFEHWIIYIPLARVFHFDIPHWYLIIGILSSLYICAHIAVRKFTHTFIDWFYRISAIWLGIIFLLFTVSLIYQCIYLTTGYDSVLLLGSLYATVFALSLYALIHGRSLKTHEHTLPITGLKKIIKIVHLSDIHLGAVHQVSFLERIVEETNALTPDIVCITGDLFDGSAPISEAMLLPLNKINAPAFFSNGNHEEYTGLKRVRDTLRNIDVHLLDSTVMIEQEIQIIGVNDRESLPSKVKLSSIIEAMEIQKDVPTVLLYHTPMNWDEARVHGIDLMLSGHTHNGQIYPFTLLVRLFFRYINGVYETDGKFLHVSPGTGTWGPPMRLGSYNQITLLTLTPR